MQESQCRSVWAYAVEHKGSSEAWVVDQIAEDLETIGLRNDRVMIKSDQETSANDIAKGSPNVEHRHMGLHLRTQPLGTPTAMALWKEQSRMSKASAAQ